VEYQTKNKNLKSGIKISCFTPKCNTNATRNNPGKTAGISLLSLIILYTLLSPKKLIFQCTRT